MFRILGPLEVESGRRLVDLGGQKQRALLARLLVDANHVVSVDRLVDALWDDDPPETAQKALQVYVSQLRKILGRERIVTRAPGYEIRLEPSELDAIQFEQFAAAGHSAEALALWRGPPLPEFVSDAFAQPHIARWEELRLACIEQRTDADLASSKHAAVIGELEGLVREHPHRERLIAQLMLALYRSGRQAEALDVYAAARTRFADELGLDPSAPLKELHLAILRQDTSLELPAAVPADSARDSSSSAFVGREAELAELSDGLADVVAGRGRLVFLVGEPGIGKSRLAEELVRQAREQGALVLVGRCWEAGGAPAYWPWVQVLRTYVREATDDELHADVGIGGAEIAQIVPELRHRLPDLPAPVSLEADGARFRLFDAVFDLLQRVARARPLVLVLDDLHAADAPSLLLLQFVARSLATTRMLVLGAYRDVDPVPAGPLLELLAGVVREPTATRILLRGLTKDAVEEYLNLSAGELASPTLSAALHDATEGNALFLAEMVRLLAADGIDDGIAIPQSVRDVIALRLGHLSDECRRLLGCASILGREFALAPLARLATRSEDELLEVLDEALTARVVSNLPGVHDRLRFAHVLIRDTLYDGLASARRVRLHRQVVDALEATHGETSGRHLAELAHHAFAGNDLRKGIEYAHRAGDRALELLAYEEAARQYSAALEALAASPDDDGELRCELLLGIGEAQVRSGETAVAKETFLEAAELARRLDLPRLFASAAAGYAREDMYLRKGGDARLVGLIEEALGVVDETNVELRARLLGRLGGALRDELSRSRRDDVSRTAIELARRSGNRAALAYALDGRIAAIAGPDTVEECLALATELCELAESIPDVPRIIHGTLHGMIAKLTLGDCSEIASGLDRVTDLAEQLREPAQLWDAVAARAAFALAEGRLAEGAELSERAFEIGERAKPEAAIPVYRLQRFTHHDLRGELAEVERELHELVDGYPARVAFRCVLINVDARQGRVEAARQALHELGRTHFSAIPFDQEWLFGASFLAETAALLHDADSAATLYERLAPYETLVAADWPEGIRGAVSRYLALLAATTARPDDAVRHFEHALELNERLGFRPWLAHTQVDYARFSAARDPHRTEELLSEAVKTYKELGMDSHASSVSGAALASELS